MCKTKFSYEQFCTYMGKNIIIEEIYSSDGKKTVVCTNTKCPNNENECANKLRQKN